MENKIIAVIGATGSQGTGVVDALIKDGTFKVRAITRHPKEYSGKAQEVVKGNLNEYDALTEAFKNAYGVFVVTNFWEGADEITQGKTAVKAAKAAGVKHFIWSTLPNVEEISNGTFEVPHFTNKAKVDGYIKNAGFEYYTFVQAAFYYQNFSGNLSPQPKEDGTTGWTLPIDAKKKAIHMADIHDLGKVVTGSFLNPEKTGRGNYLSVAAEFLSFNDILAAYEENGYDYTFTQVPEKTFSTFFEGAKEIAQMLGYFETHTYMGTDAEKQIKLAKEVATGELTTLNEWIEQN